MPASKRAWLYDTVNEKRSVLQSLLLVVLMTISLPRLAIMMPAATQ